MKDYFFFLKPKISILFNKEGLMSEGIPYNGWFTKEYFMTEGIPNCKETEYEELELGAVWYLWQHNL